MKSLFVILSVCFLLSANSQTSQTRLIDSLLISVQKSTEDSVRVKLYARISDWFIDNDIDSALLYADTLAKIAAKANNSESIVASLVTYGNIYNFSGDYAKAILYFKKAYEINKERKSVKGMANNLYSLGSANERLSNYPDAARYYFESLRMNESLPNNELAIANCLGGIAVIYFLQKDFEKSLEYSLKVITRQKSINNEMGLANEYINVADTYFRLGDSLNAAAYNLKGLELSKKLGLSFQEGIVYSQLGVLNSADPLVSLNYLFKAQKKLEEISPKFSSTILNKGEIGRAFLKMYKRGMEPDIIGDSLFVIPKTKDGILQAAGLYLQDAVAESRQSGDKDKEATFSSDLAEVQFLKGNFREAYVNLNSSHHLRDSLYSQANKNKIAALESRKEVDLRDKQIEINNLALADQRKMQVGLIAGLCLLCIIGILLFRQNQTRKNTNITLQKLNAELDEANKVKAKFFGILSHDLRGPVANLVNFLHLQKESPGLFDEKQVAANQDKIRNSAESLLETMESMLFWSKEQMVNFRPQVRSIPVTDLFEYIGKFFSHIDSTVLKFDTEPGLVVTADENYLQVIMQNLTANAIKAIQNTSQPSIEWKAGKVGDNTILSIMDNGPGISEENVRSLIDGGDMVNARTGFGFHLVRDLAKSIGWKISIRTNQSGTAILLTSSEDSDTSLFAQ